MKNLNRYPLKNSKIKDTPKKKFRLRKRHILLFSVTFLLLIFSFFKFRELFLWLILSGIASFLKYFRTGKCGHIPIVWEPSMFVAILLTKGLGLKWGLLFLLIPNPLSELMSGGMQFTMFIAGFQWTIYMLIVVMLGDLNIVAIGIIICLIDVFVGYLMNTFIWGLPPFMLIYNISHLLVHIIYFSIFGEIVLTILRSAG